MAYLTLERAEEAIPNFPSADEGILENIIEASCDSVERYCRRVFTLTSYDQLIHGTGTRSLFTPQLPIVTVSAVRTGLLPAIQVVNNSQNIQAANVQITSTSLVLTLTNNATTTTNTLLYATYPTCGDLGDAINALGNNWVAVVAGQFDSWSSTDLGAMPRTLSARNLTASLMVHWWYLSEYRVNQDLGEIYSAAGFLRGYENYRVTYTAGYATIPDDLLQATGELAKATYLYRNINPSLQSETIGAYSYSQAVGLGWKQLSPWALATLNNYKIIQPARWTAP